MSTATQLTPIQAGAAIALGFGLNLSAVAAEFAIHRSTLHNWMKDPVFAQSVQGAQAEFQTQFRSQLAMLTRLALETLHEFLTDPEASPALRLKAALAVLKQDWKLPHSTDFDTPSQPEDSLRNETPPDPPVAAEPQPEPEPAAADTGFDTFRHPDPHEINEVRNEMPPQVGRNSPCPCGSGVKYKRCCGKDAPPVLYPNR